MRLEDGLLDQTQVDGVSRVPGRHEETWISMTTRSLPCPLTRFTHEGEREPVRRAPSQEPGEVSSHEEVEEAEPLAKTVNSGQGAPGADLGTAMAKTLWVCFDF